MRHLVLLFGDQLNEKISSLDGFDKKQDHILMAEVWEEATHIKHHQKKLVFTFSAMRHFAQDLTRRGYQLTYLQLDDEYISFESALDKFTAKHKLKKIIVTSPSEFRVLEKTQSWTKRFNLPIEIREDGRFLCSKSQFQSWAYNRKTLVMEYFYREMRKSYAILMDGNKPLGGKWNYDKENRKPLKSDEHVPGIALFPPDEITKQVMELVTLKFSNHFGSIKNFHYAVTRADALKALDWFVKHQLASFGDYQDAILENKPWLFHSILSLYLNIGLLLPVECLEAAIDAFKQGRVPLNAVEGYVRQILGWREYVNGIYWLKMPDYKKQNFLQAKNRLPDFYWHGSTPLNCLKQCISDTYENAYAHHIQRLMVLGNFCLLIGVNPGEVNTWYWIVYADAYEWVELPNVSGMVLFADGGMLGSKPYAASGSYINKMSNYCKNCCYDVKQKTGDKACPFNYLYWHFINKNREILSHNQRMRMTYNTLNKMSTDKLTEITKNANEFINNLGINNHE